MLLKDKYEKFLEYIRQQNYKPHTIESYRLYLYGSLSHSVQDIDLKDLVKSDSVKVVEAGRKHGTNGATRSIVVFRSYLKYLEDSGFKINFYWQDIPVPPPPYNEQDIFEVEEMWEVFEKIPLECKFSKSNKTHFSMAGLALRTYMEVLAGTGMRLHEPLGLLRRDFDTIKRHKELSIAGKGNKKETVWFSDRAIEWLGKYLSQRKDNCEAMFVNNEGRPKKYNTIKSNLRKFISNHPDDPLIQRLGFHIIRRTFLTYLFEMGADLKSVQMAARHSSPYTTMRHYIRANKKRAKESCLGILNKK